ncbi:AraC family transcriptional regulator [Pseudomonas sp. HR96]|uniref:AraC family transcriptional regulator n=1 Tax=Pseudomonas sp. HR96 TaxID=1027966 RepID=UPI002A75A0FA|nr:AraC family transcriptional regulator [Pseudomonas sp. HR96]WPP01803.1 AraC family transcriptional regulator [Pseudomonas sp. HR96]
MSHYWRHPAVAHIEIRNVVDGRGFSHEPHAHATFSIGAIIGGRSTYLNGHHTREIGAGSLVLINPGVVHACNPLTEEPWAYRMFYVDATWLATLQRPSGTSTQAAFQPFAEQYSDDAQLFAGLEQLYRQLTAPAASAGELQAAAREYFQQLLRRLTPSAQPPVQDKLLRAAELIRQRCLQPLPLEEIGAAVQLSPSYLIRAFKAQYGLTPHGYLIDCRLQLAREALRRGEPIAAVAAQAGFADQAHLQRQFKRALAATPGQYRRPSVQQH